MEKLKIGSKLLCLMVLKTFMIAIWDCFKQFWSIIERFTIENLRYFQKSQHDCCRWAPKPTPHPVSLYPSFTLSQCPGVPVSLCLSQQGGTEKQTRGGGRRNTHFSGWTDLHSGSYRGGTHLKNALTQSIFGLGKYAFF